MAASTGVEDHAWPPGASVAPAIGRLAMSSPGKTRFTRRLDKLAVETIAFARLQVAQHGFESHSAVCFGLGGRKSEFPSIGSAWRAACRSHRASKQTTRPCWTSKVGCLPCASLNNDGASGNMHRIERNAAGRRTRAPGGSRRNRSSCRLPLRRRRASAPAGSTRPGVASSTPLNSDATLSQTINPSALKIDSPVRPGPVGDADLLEANIRRRQQLQIDVAAHANLTAKLPRSFLLEYAAKVRPV